MNTLEVHVDENGKVAVYIEGEDFFKSYAIDIKAPIAPQIYNAAMIHNCNRVEFGDNCSAMMITSINKYFADQRAAPTMNDCTRNEEKTPMKAIITVSNESMHIIDTNSDGSVYDNVITFGLFPVDAVVTMAQYTHADLYFAPSVKQSFIDAVKKAMGA